MYPQPDLALLAHRKRELMGRIRASRLECALHLSGVLKPVLWADGIRQKWRSISPVTKFAVLPVGLFVARKLMPRMGGLLGWAPTAFSIFRAFR
jgi:hypothetical protein